MKQLNILVIDDNHDLVEILQLVLETEDHQVEVAYNGADGLKLFDQGSFDIVLLDAKLPDMTGLEIFHELHKKAPDMAILMMTGYRIEQLLDSIVEDGSVALLRQPVAMETVIEALDPVNDNRLLLIEKTHNDFPEQLWDSLSANNLSTYLARSRQQAYDGMSSMNPDVLILDMDMAITYSVETCCELKHQGLGAKTIILTSCIADQLDRDPLKSALVTGCLFKPFKPDDLLRVIEQLV